tara:strand:- start:320 stop:631 length:312 start_codon:yes stop_codon:yes gene_type:complete
MEATKKPQKKRIKRAEVMPKKEKSKDIDYKTLKKFVGDVENMWKIEAKHLYYNRYRINVWTESYEEGMFSPIYKIEKSYFVHYKDGEIIDKTIPQKPKQERFF